jgi:hypothetical protein
MGAQDTLLSQVSLASCRKYGFQISGMETISLFPPPWGWTWDWDKTEATRGGSEISVRNRDWCVKRLVLVEIVLDSPYLQRAEADGDRSDHRAEPNGKNVGHPSNLAQSAGKGSMRSLTASPCWYRPTGRIIHSTQRQDLPRRWIMTSMSTFCWQNRTVSEGWDINWACIGVFASQEPQSQTCLISYKVPIVLVLACKPSALCSPSPLVIWTAGLTPEPVIARMLCQLAFQPEAIKGNTTWK